MQAGAPRIGSVAIAAVVAVSGTSMIAEARILLGLGQGKPRNTSLRPGASHLGPETVAGQ
jgi:hypothetical protein